MQKHKRGLLPARARTHVSSSTVESDKGPELTYTFIQMVLCFCNSIADWLNRMRARGTFKPRIPIRIGSGLAWVGGYRDFFLIGRATLPAGIPRASAFLRPSPPLRACPGFSLVLTFPPVFLSLRGIFLSILRHCLILLPQCHYLNGTDLLFYKGY